MIRRPAAQRPADRRPQPHPTIPLPEPGTCILGDDTRPQCWAGCPSHGWQWRLEPLRVQLGFSDDDDDEDDELVEVA
jgi:hypothetical protein